MSEKKIIEPSGPETTATIEVDSGTKHEYTTPGLTALIRVKVDEVAELTVTRDHAQEPSSPVNLEGFSVSGPEFQPVSFRKTPTDADYEVLDHDVAILFTGSAQAAETSNGVVRVPFKGRGYVSVKVKDRGRTFVFAPVIPEGEENRITKFVVTAQGVT